jgi:hypothetical protein
MEQDFFQVGVKNLRSIYTNFTVYCVKCSDSLFEDGSHITHFQDSEELFLRFRNLISEFHGFYNARNSNTGISLFGQADHENNSKHNRQAVGFE